MYHEISQKCSICKVTYDICGEFLYWYSHCFGVFQIFLHFRGRKHWNDFTNLFFLGELLRVTYTWFHPLLDLSLSLIWIKYNYNIYCCCSGLNKLWPHAGFRYTSWLAPLAVAVWMLTLFLLRITSGGNILLYFISNWLVCAR